MLGMLEEILRTGTIDRVEEYEWRGRKYLRLFMVDEITWSWDGPKTEEALDLINAAWPAHRQRARKRKRATRTFKRRRSQSVGLKGHLSVPKT
jgi:hypothetical protein